MTQAKVPIMLDSERAKYVNREIKYEEEIKSLRQQLAESQKREVMLRQLIPSRIPDGFVSFGKYYSEQEDKFNDPYNLMCKFKRKYLSDCEEALAATADLDGLILCHAKPMAWTYDKGPIIDVGAKVPLYRAWEQKP